MLWEAVSLKNGYEDRLIAIKNVKSTIAVSSHLKPVLTFLLTIPEHAMLSTNHFMNHIPLRSITILSAYSENCSHLQQHPCF